MVEAGTTPPLVSLPSTPVPLVWLGNLLGLLTGQHLQGPGLDPFLLGRLLSEWQSLELVLFGWELSEHMLDGEAHFSLSLHGQVDVC